jgi:glycosyltransferase involved in cell wall biosynthesis
LSVVLCTYNRQKSLRRTLGSLANMSVPAGLAWELVVVDNNSTDRTRDVVEEFARGTVVDVRYVFERKQGLAHARTRGVAEASGHVIAFTDDDVVVDQHWLTGLVNAFADRDAASVGGKILPVWEQPCPGWLTTDLWGYLALLDHGEESRDLDVPDLWGANFAVRRTVLEKYGGFDTALGRVPGKLYAGEETMLLRRLLEAGERISYTPAALVYHHVPVSRMRKAYFRRWRFDEGELHAIVMGRYDARNILGIPLYMIKRTGVALLSWLARPAGSKGFHRELELLGCLGFVSARLKLALGGRSR